MKVFFVFHLFSTFSTHLSDQHGPIHRASRGNPLAKAVQEARKEAAAQRKKVGGTVRYVPWGEWNNPWDDVKLEKDEKLKNEKKMT